MKFCMVSTFYPPYAFGGDAIMLARLCERLARLGHEVDVIHCSDSFHLFADSVDSDAFPEIPGVQVHRLESVVGGLGPLAAHQTGSPLFTKSKIEKILRSKEYDVIHYHNISLLGFAVLGLRAAGDPIRIYTAHDHWLVCPLTVLWKDDEYPCDEATCFSCMRRAGRPPQWWRHGTRFQQALTGVDRFLAPSRSCADMHRERGFKQPMQTLPFFVPSASSMGRSKAAPHGRPYFLVVSRLVKYKGIQDAIEAFQGSGDYDLIVVGSGEYEDALKRQAADAERVIFHGWVPPDQLDDFYRHATGVIVPSLTHETFGLTVVEAAARSTPAIVRDRGSLAELADQAGGLKFSSPAELRACAERIHGDAELRRRLGRQAYEAYNERWRPERHLRDYVAIIHEAQAARSQLAEAR